MSDCLFCRIIAGEIPSDKVYEDGDILAFRDVAPQAPVHVLIVPKKHMASLDDACEQDAALLGHIMVKIREIARELGLESGYRVVINTGEDGMQTVQHLHVHLLGKRRMLWPPG